MKIAIVTQGYLSGGGVPSIVGWLRKGLLLRGHEAHVHDLAGSSRDPQSRRVTSPSTWLRPITPLTVSADGVFHWGANWVEIEGQRYRPRDPLTQILNNYDVVQVVAGAPALALAVSKVTAPKVLQVATSLSTERPTQLGGMPVIKRRLKMATLPRLIALERNALQHVDAVLVENQMMLSWVKAHGGKGVIFAPPGIDTGLFRPAKKWSSAGPILAFGRLADPRKDWPTAVRAYEWAVRASNLPNDLVLAGKGPAPESIFDQVALSPLKDRISIVQDVPFDELPLLMASCSVFLQSSFEEGLGLAGLEAMSCGLPVVATRTFGSAEYVKSGRNGFLVNLGPGTVPGLGRGLIDVLQDDERGRSMSVAARDTCVQGYDSDRALEGFVHVYERLAGNSGST